MEIQVHIPRPLLTLTIIVVIVLWMTGILSIALPWAEKNTDALGGQTEISTIVEARKTIDRESIKRIVLEKKEEILRYQFLELQKRIDAEPSEEKKQELRDIRTQLLEIIRKKSDAENLITASLLDLWEAEGTQFTTEKTIVTELMEWPVQPLLGISAFFQDSAYKKRFGFDHNAIDIPIDQGNSIVAAAAGTVEKVALNGLGYSYVTLRHERGITTTYGHISSSLVREGDPVLRGQVVAQSGGEPGTEGAGLLTTGPHVHFAVRVNGILVDPMQFLPKIRSIDL